jgi:hypothetical protein
MKVIIHHIRVEPTKHAPYNDIVHIHGTYLDELNKKHKCRCYINPENRNWQYWLAVIDEMAKNKGNDFVLSGMSFKNKEYGLLTADCKPVLEEIIPKPLKSTTYVRPPKEPTGSLTQNELFTIED